jgi:hypothetical protein
MKNNTTFVPVKKILNIINSCKTDEQLDNCRILIDNYVETVKRKGVVNYDELEDRLVEELEQRQEALYLVKIFT